MTCHRRSVDAWEGSPDGGDNVNGGVLPGTQGVDGGDYAAPSEVGSLPPTGEMSSPTPSTPSQTSTDSQPFERVMDGLSGEAKPPTNESKDERGEDAES